MIDVYELKQQHENKVSALIKECAMFFAFSKSQFEENKTPLAEGDKYVDAGMGGFMPKSNVDKWCAGIDAIDEWWKEVMKDPEIRTANIAYELGNHEAYYTYSIESTLDALGPDYTRDEVQAVYAVELRKYQQYLQEHPEEA